MSGEERKALILDAALNVFAQKGFSGARTKEIAREAGISETLVFRHFQSKQNLYRLALEHLFSGHPIIDDLKPAVAANDDRGVLYVLAKHIMENCRRDGRIVRLALFSGLEGRGRSEQERIALQVLTGYFQRRMDEGALKAMDPGLAARFFLFSVFMYSSDIHLHLTESAPPVEDSQAAETLTDIFLNGLLPR